MKRIVCLLLCACLLFVGCAENEINNDKENERFHGIYSGTTSTFGGFLNFISKKTRNQKPALKGYDHFYHLEFDHRFLEDDRFITTDAYYGDTLAMEDGSTVDAKMPTGNFLTEPDGRRQKLCPNKTCRVDEERYCTHVNLSGGIVDGRYVYYIGKYKNKKRVSKNGGYANYYTNYLMRYDIAENEERVMLDLPWWAGITSVGNGMLYIHINAIANESGSVNSRSQRVILYDLQQHIVAEVMNVSALDFYDGVWVNGWMIYGSGDGITRVRYDLAETEHFTYPSGGYSFGHAVGAARNKAYVYATDWETGDGVLMSVDENGGIRLVWEGIDDAVVKNNRLYTQVDGKITEYKLSAVGRVREDTARLLFDVAVSGVQGETIFRTQSYGDGLLVQTLEPGRLKSYRITGDGEVEFLGGAALDE